MRSLLLLLTSTLAAAACPAPPPPEQACAICVEEKCADLLALCAPDPACACMRDCLGAQGLADVVDGACLRSCGLDELPAAFDEVEECAAFACPDAEDECAAPSDFTPADGNVLSTTDDIGGGDLADCGLDRGLPFDAAGPVVQLESFDGHVCVRLERTVDGPGEQANTAYTLVELRAGPLGRVSRVRVVDDPAALCFYASHHNFRDVAHAWTGSRHHDVVLDELGHGGARVYELHTFAAGPLDGECGAVPDGDGLIGEPLELFPVND